MLLELEEAFWRAAGDREAYERNLAADAVHVFPGMGVTDRERALAGAAGAQTWESFEIQDPQFVRLADGVAALVYTASAQHAGNAPYTAAMTSVYRLGEQGWELVLHQQTPLEPRDEG